MVRMVETRSRASATSSTTSTVPFVCVTETPIVIGPALRGGQRSRAQLSYRMRRRMDEIIGTDRQPGDRQGPDSVRHGVGEGGRGADGAPLAHPLEPAGHPGGRGLEVADLEGGHAVCLREG